MRRFPTPLNLFLHFHLEKSPQKSSIETLLLTFKADQSHFLLLIEPVSYSMRPAIGAKGKTAMVFYKTLAKAIQE